MLTYATYAASVAKRVEELDDLDEAQRSRATVLELGFEIKMTKKVLMRIPYVSIRQHMSAYVSIRHARACARTSHAGVC
jgi:hypothetical protein